MKKSPLIVIFLVVFIDLVGFGIIIPLGPYLGAQVGATPFEIGLLMSIYSIMQFLFAPMWGRLSDRMGRRPIILTSLLGGACAHALYAFSNDVWMLFLGRGLAGFFGANISAAMAYIADVTDKKDRSKNMGLIGAAFGLGFILGPPIGGFLGEIGANISHSPPFGLGFGALGASFICFFNFLLALKVLKESLTPEVRARLSERESRFVMIKKFVTKKILGALLILGLLMALAMANMESTLGLYVKDRWDWSLKQTGFAFAYIGILHVITQGFIVRKLMPKLGEARMMTLGLILATIGFTGIAFAGSTIPLAVTVTLLGFGTGIFNPALMGSISLTAEPQDQGAAMGVQQSFSALGRIFGPMSAGWVYENIDRSASFILAGIFSLSGLVIIVGLYSKLPHSGLSKEHG